MLLLAALLLAGSAQSASRRPGTNDQPFDVAQGRRRTGNAASASVNPLWQSQSVDSTRAGRPQPQVTATWRSSPVMFIENVGQFDQRARFQVRGGMGTVWLAEDAIWITLLGRKEIRD